MAERLTYWNDKEKKSALPKCINDFGDVVDLEDLCYKLACFEDMLEMYGVDIQNLDYILEDYSKNQGRDFAICEERDDLKKDRDTWKKACELACETLKQVMGKPLWIGGNIPAPEVKDTEYFYQQAKKEKEEQNNDTNQ